MFARVAAVLIACSLIVLPAAATEIVVGHVASYTGPIAKDIDLSVITSDGKLRY